MKTQFDKSQLVFGSFLMWIALSLTTRSFAVDPSELVQDITHIASGGAPGAIHPLSDDWWGIAAGDEDASFPSLFVAAREFGAGRVITVGHDGLIHRVEFDNDQFRLNIVQWLDTSGNGVVGFTTGHSEWVNANTLSHLETQLNDIDMNLSPIAAPVTANELNGVSVLIAGNAWSDFTKAEIEAVRQWVNDGGGLLLLGLGWSWEPYHPGESIEDYPMMKLAEPYEIRWLRNGIDDPTDGWGDGTVFSKLYPEIPVVSSGDAITTIETAHNLHGSSLPSVLEVIPDFRLAFVRAHQILAIPAREYPLSHPARSAVFDTYTNFFDLYGMFYARGFSYDESAHPTATRLRERAWRTWRDCVQLTPDVKATMAILGQLQATRLSIFTSHDVIVMDNDRLSQKQLAVIENHLSLVPNDLHHLRAISVRDFLGSPDIVIDLKGQPGSVNVFGIPIGGAHENQFPDDVAPGEVDVFSIVVAHELNHVVDAFTIGMSPSLHARKDTLISDAGTDPLNYLRSGLPPGFFVNNPQEFFASISNQWFSDSATTLELGVVRFDAGRAHPINQALFFADVYSDGEDITYLYSMGVDGNLSRRRTPLMRNADGFIDSIEFDSHRYTFELDELGRVSGYEIQHIADLNSDGVVSVLDLLALLANWGTDGPGAALAEPNDVVNVLDLLELLAQWG